MRKGVKEDIHYVTYFTICLIIVILIFHSIILHKIKNGTTIFK